MRRVKVVAVAVLVAMLSTFAVAAPAGAATTTARNLAIALVTKAEGGSTTYGRDYRATNYHLGIVATSMFNYARERAELWAQHYHEYL